MTRNRNVFLGTATELASLPSTGFRPGTRFVDETNKVEYTLYSDGTWRSTNKTASSESETSYEYHVGS